MLSSKPLPVRARRPIRVSLGIIANLIYLSRRAQTHSFQQHQYLDCVAEVVAEIARHPRFDTGRYDR